MWAAGGLPGREQISATGQDEPGAHLIAETTPCISSESRSLGQSSPLGPLEREVGPWQIDLAI